MKRNPTEVFCSPKCRSVFNQFPPKSKTHESTTFFFQTTVLLMLLNTLEKKTTLILIHGLKDTHDWLTCKYLFLESMAITDYSVLWIQMIKLLEKDLLVPFFKGDSTTDTFRKSNGQLCIRAKKELVVASLNKVV